MSEISSLWRLQALQFSRKNKRLKVEIELLKRKNKSLEKQLIGIRVDYERTIDLLQTEIFDFKHIILEVRRLNNLPYQVENRFPQHEISNLIKLLVK